MSVRVPRTRIRSPQVTRSGRLLEPHRPSRSTSKTGSLKVAKDVNDETAKQLRASLGEGVLAGEGLTELRARVESVMGHASTMRADNIAQYEVSHAQLNWPLVRQPPAPGTR